MAKRKQQKRPSKAREEEVEDGKGNNNKRGTEKQPNTTIGKHHCTVPAVAHWDLEHHMLPLRGTFFVWSTVTFPRFVHSYKY